MYDAVRSILNLSKPEFTIYITLLTVGPTSTGRLCEETKIASSHIYTYLDTLIQKGLVTWNLTNMIKTYSAVSSKNITKLLNDSLQKMNVEAEDFANYIDKIEHRTETQLPSVRIYRGISGVITAINKALTTLSENETYYVLGSTTLVNKKLNEFFIEFHKERIRKKIHFKILYDENSKKFAEERSKSKYSEVRLSKFRCNCEMTIFKSTVQLIVFSEIPVVIEIEHADIADTFQEYFFLLWQFSSKLGRHS